MSFKCYKKWIQWAVFILCLIALVGCFSTEPKADPTRFYTLSALTLMEAQDDAVDVAVLQLPYYLSSRKIAIRSDAYEVEYLEFHRWAEPLDVMIERKLESELTRVQFSGQLEIIITRFEATGDGEVVLATEWRLKEGNTVLDKGVFSSQQSWRKNAPTKEMVVSLSALLEELADHIEKTASYQ